MTHITILIESQLLLTVLKPGVGSSAKLVGIKLNQPIAHKSDMRMKRDLNRLFNLYIPFGLR